MNFFRTVAHVDLEALQHNLACVKKMAPRSWILALVKGDAYGHGIVEVAEAIKSQADALGVASVQEALELYSNSIDARIVILGGFLDGRELRTIADCGFEAVVHNQEQLDVLENTKIKKPIVVWLKIDTGMHRLGLQPREVLKANKRLLKNNQVQKPLYFLTHFSDSEVLAKKKTLKQISLFKETVDDLKGEKALANSAAIFNWPQAHASWVRPGIFLYGISSLNNLSAQALGLKPVLTLTSKIVAIKKIKKGEAIGYGSTWKCPKDTRVGVVATGYADGYPWHIKSKTPVLIGKRLCPIVGRISMDYLSVDLTKLPKTKVGDQVILWGRGLPIETIARQAGTSPYELNCQLTKRVKYKYYKKSVALQRELV